MQSKKITIALIVIITISSLIPQMLARSFDATPDNEPEYGSWNVSEHVHYHVQDEADWIFMNYQAYAESETSTRIIVFIYKPEMQKIPIPPSL